MSELRWVLLLIGLTIIVGTLVYAQFTQRKQERDLFDGSSAADPLLGDDIKSVAAELDDEDEYRGEATFQQSDDTYSVASESTAELNGATESEGLPQAETDQEQHVVILHVMARDAQGFDALTLKDLLEHLGLRFGNYGFYHRESLQNPDISLFSVANMFKPGAFDPDDISSYATRGISFFMVLPGPPDAVTTFNEMQQTAKQLASKLEADIFDSDHSSFSGQRAQLIRDEIISFMHKVTQL